MLMRAVWKCPIPQVMTAGPVANESGQRGKMAGRRHRKDPRSSYRCCSWQLVCSVAGPFVHTLAQVVQQKTLPSPSTRFEIRGFLFRNFLCVSVAAVTARTRSCSVTSLAMYSAQF